MYVRKTLLSLFIALCLAQVGTGLDEEQSSPEKNNPTPRGNSLIPEHKTRDNATGNDESGGRGTKESKERLDTAAGPSPLSGKQMEEGEKPLTVGIAYQSTKIHSDTAPGPPEDYLLRQVNDQGKSTILQPHSEAELLTEFIQLDKRQKLAVVFIVNNHIGKSYDRKFDVLSRLCTESVFFKIDSSDFFTTGQFKIEDNSAFPLIYLRKYGFTKDSFEYKNQNISKIIKFRETSTREEFINAGAEMILADRSTQWNNKIDVLREDYGHILNSGLRGDKYGSEFNAVKTLKECNLNLKNVLKQLTKYVVYNSRRMPTFSLNALKMTNLKIQEIAVLLGHFGNGIQHATSVDKLDNILNAAKVDPDILSVIYIVKSGDVHDPTVKKLASKFTSTFFIKITSDTYTSTPGKSPYSGLPEPSFIFHRFGQFTQHISSIKKEQLEIKIANYIGMDKEKYLQTVREEAKSLPNGQ